MTMYAKPSEVATAAENSMHNLFIHSGLAFHKFSPVLFMHAQINISMYVP